jgi:type I restriction enzyme S subunit
MGDNWSLVKLGEFIDLKTGHPFKSKLYSDTSGVKLLRGDNIVQGQFRWANVKLWPKELVTEKESEYLLSEGDVILAMDRPWIHAGLKTAQIAQSDLPCLLVQRTARLRSKAPDDQDFLRYLITSHHFVQYVKLVQTGTAVPHISPKQIKDFTFNKPPKETRLKIGEIIKSLDKKSHLNNLTNQTLEQMAQALFKSWFVDFDPVIDNALMAGNPIPDELQVRAELRKRVIAERATNPKLKPLPDDIQQLFPSEFEHCGEPSIGIGGWIPKGWEVKTFESLISLIGGGTPKTTNNEYWSGVIPWFSVVDAPNDSDVFVIDTEKHVTQLGVDKSSTKILREGTTIISARGTVGKCALVGTPMAMNQSCYGIVGEYESHDEYIYFITRYQVSDLQKRGHGSVFNTITRETFKSISLAKSSDLLTRKFSETVRPYLLKILSNNRQNIELTKLRDVLLPKLISGDVSLPEAIIGVEA